MCANVLLQFQDIANVLLLNFVLKSNSIVCGRRSVGGQYISIVNTEGEEKFLLCNSLKSADCRAAWCLLTQHQVLAACLGLNLIEDSHVNRVRDEAKGKDVPRVTAETGIHW